MERIHVVNLSSKVRTAKFDGRDFLVVPLKMLVPGVLNGSRGPLLYREEETAQSASAWNWMPIVVNHPMSGSARVPDYMASNGVGHLANCEFKNGSLQAEGWFDVSKTNMVNPNLIPDMRAGKKIELSTGLGVDMEEARGIHNNRDYIAIARNYRPDHLAILPDTVGACSLQDGCGVNNKEGEPLLTNNAKSEGVWRTIRGAKVFIEDGRVTKGPKALRGLGEHAAHSMASHGIEKDKDTEEEYKAAKAKRDQKKKPKVDSKQLGADGGPNSLGPELVKGASASKEYKKAGIKVEMRRGAGRATSTESHATVIKKLESNGWKKNSSLQGVHFGSGGEGKVRLDKGERSVILTKSEGGYTILQTLQRRKTDDLSHIKKVADDPSYGINNQLSLLNTESPMCAKQSLIDQLVENSDGLWSEMDREQLDAFSEEKLTMLVENTCKEPMEKDEEEEDPPVGKAKMTNNQQIKLEDLPKEFLAVYNHGLEAMNREKDQLIDKLVANISDEEAKEAKIANLSKKSMCELKEIASFLPHVNNSQEDDSFFAPAYTYRGAAVGNVHNQAKFVPEPLGLPEMDFSA